MTGRLSRRLLIIFIFALIATLLSVWTRKDSDFPLLAGAGEMLKKKTRQRRGGKKYSTTNSVNQTFADDVTTQQKSKPILLLHLGPSKTASSTLQAYLRKDKKLLEKDGYHFDKSFRHFMDKGECIFVSSCPVEEVTQDKYWETFVASFQSGMNIIGSNEVFGARFADEPAHWEFLKKEFSAFDVKIIFVYRRYFEMMTSEYYEQSKMDTNRVKINGGWNRSLPIFVDWYHHYRKQTKSIHPLERNQIKWESHFPDLSIFNLHRSPENFVGDFFCNMIPNATNACSHRVEKGLEGSFHIGKTLNYDILAVRAYKDGLLDGENMTRVQASDAIRQRQEDSLNLSAVDFPLICLSSKEEEDLLKVSLSHELKLQPDWHARGEAEHRSKFSDAVNKHKFCSMNSTAVIMDNGWRQFFLSI